jgi:hypothetical protein
MRRKLPGVLVSAGFFFCLCAGAAWGDPPTQAAEPATASSPQIPPEKMHVPDPDHTFERAGYPDKVSKLAHATDTGKYCGYYVGGGAAFGGEPRHPGEGTWGWDYCGCRWLPHRVVLCWWHGRKSQGGAGAYKTDGPPFPEPPYVPRLGHGCKE